MNKIAFTGRIVSVKARIRLTRSFDQIPTHQYQGYTLILNGEVDGISRNRFKVAIGPKAHEQHQFRMGDLINGLAIPVTDAETEWAEFYKVSGLKLIERTQPDAPPSPTGGIVPPLEQYREQGHFRLQEINGSWNLFQPRSRSSLHQPTLGEWPDCPSLRASREQFYVPTRLALFTPTESSAHAGLTAPVERGYR
jgi:hypothetical protein